MKKISILIINVIVFFCLFNCKNEKQIIIKKEIATKPKGIWIDYVLGGPPLPNEFKAIDSLTKKYNINYKRVEFGCEYTNNDILQKEKYNIENAKYFKELEAVLGKNWKQNFDKEKVKLDSLFCR